MGVVPSSDELGSLSAEELTARLRPIVRRATIGEPDRRARYEENLPGAFAELLELWNSGDRLRDGDDTFQGYFAARLPTLLRRIDEEQQPDLYDAHRRSFTHPDAQVPGPSQPLDEISETEAEARPLAAQPQPAALASLVRQMSALGIPPASQAGALAYLAGVQAGSIANGRQAAKALGLPDWKTRPATSALLPALEFVEGMGPIEPPQFNVSPERL